MAERTITFDGAIDNDPSREVVEVGGLRFTVAAQGDWTFSLSDGRLVFTEDPNYGGSQFNIVVTTVDGNLIKPVSADIQYDGTPEIHSNNRPPYLAIMTDSTGTTTSDSRFLSGTHITWAGTGVTPSTSIRMYDYIPETADNPTSQFWIDNFVVDTDTPSPKAAPVIQSVSSPEQNRSYKVGDVLQLTITFDKAIDVNTAGGIPTLRLETGSTDRDAVYYSGSGTSTLTFKYTVQAGDTSADLNYLSTAALTLNGATVKLSGGTTDATLTLPTPGAAGSLGTNKAIIVDGIAPAVFITSSKSALKVGESTTITFTFSEDPGASFNNGDITVSGGTLGTLSGSGLTRIATFTPTANTDNGTASITVAAGQYTDAAGNLGGAGATPSITFDTRAPATTVASAILSADSGTSGNDFITNVAAQTVSGTLSASLAAGERVEVSLDNGSTWSMAAAAVGSSTWSFAATLAGSNTLQVRVVDAAGNAGSVHSQAYTLDTNAPAAPSTPNLDAGSDTGSLNDDDITGDTTPTFSGTAEVGATVTLFINDNSVGSGEADANGKWTITTAQLDGGSYDVTVKATDLAGNQSGASAPLGVTVITAAPETANTSFILSSDTGVSQGDLVTRKASQTLSGRLDAALVAGEQVQVWIDGAWQTATAASGSDTWSLAAILEEGTHEVQVRVVNAIDNAGPIGKYNYTLDTTAPSVVITSDVAQLKAGETATITFTFSEDPAASFTWNGSSGDVTVSGGTLSAISGTGLTRTAIFTPSANTNLGAASITVAAGSYADLAANIGTAGITPSLRFDTLSPVTPTAPVLAAESDSGISASDNVTNGNVLTLTGTAEAGTTIRLYDTDGVTEVGSTVASGGAWSITTAPLATGSHTLVARATDVAGNTSPTSAGLSITVDRAAPTLVHSSPTENATNVAKSANLVLTFSEAVYKGSGMIELHAGNGTVVESFDVATSTRINIVGDVLTLDPTSPFSDGTGYYLTISAGAITDVAGNNFAGLTDSTAFNFTSEGALIVPNTQGGTDITIVDPGQLTAGLGTSAADTVLYAGSGTVTLPDAVESIRLSGVTDANAVGNGLSNFFQGNTGDNLFDGATGKDAIFYDVSLADVSLSYNADGTLTVSGAGIGTDTLKNIELLHFADQVVLAHPPPAHAPGLFNEAWYLLQNPDVAAAVKAGAFSHGYEHFLRNGAQEGRAAAPGTSGWDEQFYLAHNPDVAAAVKTGAVASGFEHFLTFGAQEGRSAKADGLGWDETFYLEHNPDVAAAVKAGGPASGLEHFLRSGGAEGRAADPQARGVDEQFYLDQNPDVAAAVQAGWLSSGMDHYFTWGAQEGRAPNALFDEAWYLSHNVDVAAAVKAGAFASGYDHYRHYGCAEGRDPSEWFDLSAYLTANPDVAAAHVDPLTHYLTYGVREGRMIVPSGTDLWG
jgi:hypothetical protein